MEPHVYGKPVNILNFSADNKVLIDKTALDEMFLDAEVKTRKIVIVSIIGAFRKGKSFFLDYCLRYMYANYRSIANPSNELNNKVDWMGKENEPLQGFSWRSGVERETTGIIMWSDVFLHTTEKGEMWAIVLMDTQGLFDNKTSSAENSKIFALGTLLSSVQILNIISIIQEDQLQYLQFATEFARFAARDNNDANSKQFQNLLFLIRDWNNPEDFQFGMEGGKNYLKKVLKVENSQTSELKAVRQFVNASFEQIDCCLMPYPGKEVARHKSYDGSWNTMDEEFKEELVILIPKILAPENLVLKKINSKDLNCFEMRGYIESYFTLFQSDTLPQAESIYESTIDKQMNILVAKCANTYDLNVTQNKDLSTEQTLHIFHGMSRAVAILRFKEEKKMGNTEHEKKYRNELEKQIHEIKSKWTKETMRKIKIENWNQKKAKDAKEAERISIQQIKAKDLELVIAENVRILQEKQGIEFRLETEKLRATSAEGELKAEKNCNEIQRETIQTLHDKLKLKEAMEDEKISNQQFKDSDKEKELNKIKAFNEKQQETIQTLHENLRLKDKVIEYNFFCKFNLKTPVTVMEFSSNKIMLFDKTALDAIFLHPEVVTRNIVIVSIMGALRKGKSFFLNYCLRYMYANYRSIAKPCNPIANKLNNFDWMGKENEILQGFSWRSGVERETTGIIMWSDVFLHTDDSGQELAIVLMDTQGLFDNKTSTAENSRILALGTLISSVQILNIFSIIQEDQLQYLQFATEFARFAARDNNDANSKPFQNLLFLIRDWNSPKEFQFGMEGGKSYLKKVLKVKKSQKSELRAVREFVNASFEQIDCCLMPYPGVKVADNSKYDGNWGNMEADFEDELAILIPKILAPENLVEKKINDIDLNCFEMKEYIKSLFTLFQSDTLPQVQSIYESTIRTRNKIIIKRTFHGLK